MSRIQRGFLGVALALTLILACGASPEEAVLRAGEGAPGLWVDPPAADGALAPNFARVGEFVAVSWLEPVEDEGEAAHRLRFARLSGGAWSAPVTVVEGGDFFANWADLPAVVEMGSGELLAHWLAKTGDDTYAYSIFLARSADGGSTWTPSGQLNSDATDTEHGFVSWVPEGDGARAFWLDGREMAAGGAMAVRTAFVGDAVGGEELLDERTCECCSIDATVATDGPLIVYRDRGETEVRDVAIVRRESSGWSEPQPVLVDAWKINGCPVNGPAVAARGTSVVVAWFTGADSAPRVQITFSDDGGATFDPVGEVDASTPLGRVDVVFDDEGRAWVVWMRSVGERAQILLQWIDRRGYRGDAVVIAETSAARASGFPRLARLGDALYVAWVDVAAAEPQRIRMKELPVSTLSG